MNDTLHTRRKKKASAKSPVEQRLPKSQVDTGGSGRERGDDYAAGYHFFLEKKTQLGSDGGFEPTWMPDALFGFQRTLVEWSIRRGRAAMFADCGLGKTLMQLVWGTNVFRKTGKPGLLLTPLAVGPQTVAEAEKFGMEAAQSRDGKVTGPITITNYQNLHKFKLEDFSFAIGDESSILKNFDGSIKAQVTEFMRKLPYRALYTATAAPNDYIELGTSSEAIGELGFMDMLGMFFKKNASTISRSDEFRNGVYRFRGHAEKDFWRWVCSWARAIRKPSDIGGDDKAFKLPKLDIRNHVVNAKTKNEEFLFDMPAVTLQEQRAERRRTLDERCEKAAGMITGTKKPAVAWCHLNDEGEMLEKLIPGSVNVEGKDDDEFKEEAFKAFSSGELRVIISKPTIAGYGMNWQHCAHQTFFPSHSFEQWYQAIRRSWRFGQKQKVVVDMVTSEGESRVLANLQKKQAAAEEMFAQLVSLINNELVIKKTEMHPNRQEIPSWL